MRRGSCLREGEEAEEEEEQTELEDKSVATERKHMV